MIHLNIRRVGEREPWTERYTFDYMDDFEGTSDEKFEHSQEGAAKWGAKLIEWFNESLREGETEREFCGARIVEED